MHLTLHQLKREFLAQRTGLLIYATAITAYVICVASGFAGELDRSQSLPLVAMVLELLETTLLILPFLISAAMGIADPPVDEEAHWRALPIRPQHLLQAKFLALIIGVILPLIVARTLALAAYGLQAWLPMMFLDLFSDLPTWILLGLALGALTGDWKKLSMTVVSLFLGMFLIILTLNNLRSTPLGDLFHILEKGLQGFTTSNVFLLGTLTILGLRYFTRWSKRTLMSVFTVVVLLTIIFFPSLTRSLVPREPIHYQDNQDHVSADFERPSQLYALTNSVPKRLANLPHSSLKIAGLPSTTFAIPLTLHSTFQVHSEDNTTITNIPSSYFRSPGQGAPILLNGTSPDLFERRVSLPSATPKHTIINPPLRKGNGFNLYEISEEQLTAHANHVFDLSVELTLQLGTYEKLAEIPLDESASLSLASGEIRLTRLQTQVTSKTQILVNELYLCFVDEDDAPYIRGNPKDSVREPDNLRYILVNENRSEACLPVKRESYRVQRLRPLSMRSTIIDYSIPIGPSKNQAPSAEWLREAKIHVFRKIPYGRTIIQMTLEDLDIKSLPLVPCPKEFENHFRYY